MTTQIQEYSQTEAALSMLREKYTDVEYDVNTPGGLADAKSGRAEVRGYRTSLETKRKELKAPALERSRLIDAEAKQITAQLVALERPIDEQIKALEARKETERQEKIEAETRRVEEIKMRIDLIREHAEAIFAAGVITDQIRQSINTVEAIRINDSFAEFRQQADDAKCSTLSKLCEALKGAVERDEEQTRIRAEREELNRLRAEQDARNEKDRLAREAEIEEARKDRYAEEEKQRKKLEAQRKRQEKEQKRIADERAKLAEEKAEKEAKEQAEQERRDRAKETAKRAEYPGEKAIVCALAQYFSVTDQVARSWLTKLKNDKKKAA